MDPDLRVALVSNRGPVSFVETEGGFDLARGAGGLAGALDPVARELGDRATWVCATTSPVDRAALEAGETGRLREELGYRVDMLDIPPATYASYYDVVSNGMLWFAHHCLWDELEEDPPREDAAAWKEYEGVNRRFAETVAADTDDDTLVLFQDYHLSFAPAELRRLRPGQTLSHFTHSSFCGRSGLEVLAGDVMERVVRGMLGADLVGFHTHAWSDAFLECCREVGLQVDGNEGCVELDGRRAWVRTYPIPIDIDDLRRRAEGPEAMAWTQRFETDRNGARYIVRADRTEPSKNIVRGFDAFGRLLDRRPDLSGNVTFIACIYPSRQSMRAYQEYEQAIRASAAAVNARHEGAIRLFLEDDFDRTLAAMRVYDVLLVNSIMDGMNLVSKEGPSVNERAGAVVLSSSAGSYEELGDLCVSIDDPLDVDATCAALERALEMPEAERQRRSHDLARRVAARLPQHWIEDQIADLAQIRSTGEPLSALR